MGALKRVYWDTMLFAYWLEENQQYATRVKAILTSMTQRRYVLCASLFTLSELLVRPTKEGNTAAQKMMEDFFRSPHVTLIDFVPAAPATFALLRAHHNLKAMDAFHLSIAAASGVDVFVTNDRRLHSVKEGGLPLIASLETDIF